MPFLNLWDSIEGFSMKNRQRRIPGMTSRYRTEQIQLTLPFQPSPISGLTEADRKAALTALVHLLLTAAGAKLEEMEDE